MRPRSARQSPGGDRRHAQNGAGVQPWAGGSKKPRQGAPRDHQRPAPD